MIHSSERKKKKKTFSIFSFKSTWTDSVSVEKLCGFFMVRNATGFDATTKLMLAVSTHCQPLFRFDSTLMVRWLCSRINKWITRALEHERNWLQCHNLWANAVTVNRPFYPIIIFAFKFWNIHETMHVYQLSNRKRLKMKSSYNRHCCQMQWITNVNAGIGTLARFCCQFNVSSWMSEWAYSHTRHYRVYLITHICIHIRDNAACASGHPATFATLLTLSSFAHSARCVKLTTKAS